MLKPHNRLVKTKEIDQVYKKGRSSYDRIIGMKILKNGLPHNRFGIIVSGKVSKKAVTRNRIKRRIRASVKEAEHELENGADYLIIALPPAAEKNFADINDSLRKLFVKLKAVKTKDTLKHKK